MKKIIILLGIIISMINIVSAVTEVDACGTLSVAGEYQLNKSISSDGTCITIGADNIDFDLMGYSIGYGNLTASSSGIYNPLYNWVNYSNGTIIHLNASATSARGIWLDGGMQNNNISYVDISANGSSSTPIYILSSHNNTILNSTTYASNGYGLYIFTSNDNTIRNVTSTSVVNSISLVTSNRNKFYDFNPITLSASTTIEAIILDNSGRNNTFVNISTLEGKKIEFNDALLSEYNLSQDNTSFVSTNLTTARTTNRTIVNWNQTNITFSETFTGITTANYAVTGLLANINYNISNNSVFEQTILSNANGDLTDFTINFTTIATTVSIVQATSEGGVGSVDIEITYEDRTNLSYNIIWNVTNITAGTQYWNVSWNGTDSGNTYDFKYNNGTTILSQIATSDNETLWFNSTSLLPEGIYYISESLPDAAYTDGYYYSYDNSTSWNYTTNSSVFLEGFSAHEWVYLSVMAHNNSFDTNSTAENTSVQIPDNPIVITNITEGYNYEYTEGQTLTANADYTDADSDIGLFSDNSSEWDINVNTGAISWVTSGVGNYSYQVTVTNSTYSSSDLVNFTVTVNEAAPPDTNTTPSITNATNATCLAHSCVVSFDVNQSNALTMVKYGLNESLLQNTTNQTVNLSRSDNPTGLTNNTKYYYSVFAWNSSNASYNTNSTIQNFTTAEDYIAPSLPNITSWGNNYTNDDSLDITVLNGTTVLFNITSNQTLTGLSTSGGLTISFGGYDGNGYKTFTSNTSVTLQAESVNGSSQIIQWNVTIYDLYAPSITSFAPETPNSTVEGIENTFNVTVNQTVNVTWYINGSLMETDPSTTTAVYTNLSSVVGSWNVTAIATNANGTASQIWLWTVTATPTSPPAITAYTPADLTPTIDVNELATFTATANQSVTWDAWSGATESVENGTYTSATQTWTTTGAKTVIIDCSNANGSCTPIQWDVTVVSDGSGGSGVDWDWLSGTISPSGVTLTTNATPNTCSVVGTTYSCGYDFVDGESYWFNFAKSGYTANNSTIVFNEDHEVFNVTLAVIPAAVIVVTNAATSIRTNGATLNGEVNFSGGGSLTMWFEYGTNGRTYPYKTATQTTSVNTTFSHGLYKSNIMANTKYYYRAVAYYNNIYYYGE